MFRMLWLALLLAALLPPAFAAGGTVVAIGGALQGGNREVWSRVVELAGGAGSRFVVLAPGSSNPAATEDGLIAQLERYGARASALRTVAEERQLELVREASGVFFGGGDQSRIVAALAPGGRPSPLLAALRELHARGGVLAGSSAGAAVMSTVMFTGGDPLAVLQSSAGTVHAAGLGFVRSGVLVDQHFVKRGRIGRLLPLLQRERVAIGLGIEEDSAVVVRDDEAEVIGSRGVLVADLRDARSVERTDGAFNIEGARLSWLEAGDRVSLASGRVTAAPRKAAGRIVGAVNPQWRPYFETDRLFADLLAERMVVAAMEQLVDSRLEQVQALSFDAEGRTPSPELGFLWRFSRGADTSAWSVGDRYTIAAVLLSVQPVRMARPLFTPSN